MYNGIWGAARLLEAHNFNTWPLVESLLPAAKTRLEVAPGLRPRLPLVGTTFVDVSAKALSVIAQRGGDTREASISNLPLRDKSFDLICALDIIEHVEDDDAALAELSRVAKPGACLLLSTPLHARCWTEFDRFVGHYRRYEPADLVALLSRHDFVIERSGVFGMKPKSNALVKLGQWFLVHQPKRAMRWYNRVLPWVAKRQKPLQLEDGLLACEEIGEVFLVCRKAQKK